MTKVRKQILGILLILMMAVFLFSGCSNDSGKGSKETSDDTMSQGEKKPGDEQDKAEKEVVINILSGTITEGVEGELEQAMADAYMAQHPNIKIHYIGTPSNELTKKMTAYITNNDLPDAFTMLPDFFPKAVELGILEDIRPYLTDEYFDGFLESALADVMVGDEMARFPWFSVPSAVIYRTDWLEETGMAVPTTWDAFLDVSKAMTKDTDGNGKIDRWGFSMVGTNNGSGTSRFMNIARNFGCEDATYADGMWMTTLDTPAFKEALKFFTDLHTVHQVVPPGPTETGYTEAVNYLATEKTGMMITGSNGMGLLLNKNPDLDGKLGSFLIPEKENAVGASAGVMGYSVSKTSEHKEIVIDYLKFMNTSKYAIDFAQKTGRLPVRKESTSAPIFNEPTYKGFIQALDKVYIPEKYPMYQQMIDAVGLAYTNIMANGVSVDEAVDYLISRNEELLLEVNN